MIEKPAFTTRQEYVARRGDAAFWRPHLDRILGRHELRAAAGAPVPGFNPTYPTFLCGDVVVKLFGGPTAWRRAYTAERGALVLVATDSQILAPGLLADGWLAEGREGAWPYLVTTRVSGVAWRDADLSREERLAVAAELGLQVRRVHALRPVGVATRADWSAVDVAPAAARSSLPPHLVAQVEDYLADLAPPDPVFVHADLIRAHVFVEGGRLRGIIDWGDALVGDRHLEVIQPFRDLFDCDRSLLQAFLDAAAWPRVPDFPRRALGHALHRQAVGLAQHDAMDVFEPIAERFPLRDIPTLDALARPLFAS